MSDLCLSQFGPLRPHAAAIVTVARIYVIGTARRRRRLYELALPAPWYWIRCHLVRYRWPCTRRSAFAVVALRYRSFSGGHAASFGCDQVGRVTLRDRGLSAAPGGCEGWYDSELVGRDSLRDRTCNAHYQHAPLLP